MEKNLVEGENNLPIKADADDVHFACSDTDSDVDYYDLDLEHNVYLTSKKTNKYSKQLKRKKESDARVNKKQIEALNEQMIKATRQSNLEPLSFLLQQQLACYKQNTHFKNEKEDKIKIAIFKAIVDENSGDTLLHMAAKNRAKNILTFLIENFADASATNNDHLTPYKCTNTVGTRLVIYQAMRTRNSTSTFKQYEWDTNVPPDDDWFEADELVNYVKRPPRRNDTSYTHVLMRMTPDNRVKELYRRKVEAYQVTNVCTVCKRAVQGKLPYFGMFCAWECMEMRRNLTDTNNYDTNLRRFYNFVGPSYQFYPS